jgi:hypothetical protein
MRIEKKPIDPNSEIRHPHLKFTSADGSRDGQRPCPWAKEKNFSKMKAGQRTSWLDKESNRL